jgi:uncharacterized membrane protein YfbV (UPF0208 family)
MKRMSVIPSVLVLILFMGTIASAAPQISAAVQANPSAMGFMNYGQYVAAKHASDNLNISADTLRTEMVDNQLSLGDAIKKLRPELSSQAMRAEIKKAEAAAKKADAEARFQAMDHLPTRLSN